MARAFVTGDVHGGMHIAKLLRRRWPEGESLTRDDFLVVCGDFGLVWSNPPSDEAERWLNWLESRPWTTLFVDGNHENHDLLDAMPVSEWHGGRVHVLPNYPHVIHLMRGQVFDMGGLGRWFAFGGAHSIDRDWRVPFVSWWPREDPSYDEMEEGLANLDAAGRAIDYVFTHDCPARLQREAIYGDSHAGGDVTCTSLNSYFTEVDAILDPSSLRQWYFGHYHRDLAFGDGVHSVLFNQVVELGMRPAPEREAIGVV